MFNIWVQQTGNLFILVPHEDTYSFQQTGDLFTLVSHENTYRFQQTDDLFTVLSRHQFVGIGKCLHVRLE
jgi:hypothetical protein